MAVDVRRLAYQIEAIRLALHPVGRAVELSPFPEMRRYISSPNQLHDLIGATPRRKFTQREVDAVVDSFDLVMLKGSYTQRR